ncbi:MAG: rod shape-determining protein MreC [Treponema sp.]|nr:rod shape-determining protein MreC [Treponema sp.]
MPPKKSSFSRFSFPELVFGILVVFSGVMLTFSSGGFIINFQQVGFSIVSAMQKGVHAVADTVENTANAVHELSRLREENRLLTEQLKNYEYLQRSNTEIRKENQRLKEQLDFSESLELRNYAAQIIGRDPDNLYSALTINKGSKNGIRKNMPVIAIQNGTIGLVGKVVTVGSFTSQVMPIYDLKSSISARIENTRDLGLLSGLGASDKPLTMRYIKKRVLDDLHFGDIIVTSGETQNYMRDIPIGSISKISVLDYDSSLDIEVTPVIDFSRLETVIVTDLKSLNPHYDGTRGIK